MAEKNATEEKQVVIFKLGDEEFGVDIAEVREIIKMENITAIPEVEDYIKGVINLRGKIIVVMDLAAKLGMPSQQTTGNTRIIVVEMDNSTIGMIVDKATEVMRLPGDKVESAPAMVTNKISKNYIKGVGVLKERLIILLDLTRVLGNNEMEKLEAAKSAA